MIQRRTRVFVERERREEEVRLMKTSGWVTFKRSSPRIVLLSWLRTFDTYHHSLSSFKRAKKKERKGAVVS